MSGSALLCGRIAPGVQLLSTVHCPPSTVHRPPSTGGTMPRFVRLYVEDETEFTDELYAFVTDPSPTSRNARPVILELNDLAPEMVDILESMVLDGVEER